MPTDFRTVPGLYTGNQFVSRQVVRSLSSRDYIPSGVIIDSSLTRDVGSSPTSVLRAGLLMGKITTGGKYRNSIIGLTNGAISAATITSITVPAAVATEVARLLAVAAGNITLRLFGPPSAAGTNAATNITVTAAAARRLRSRQRPSLRTWTSRSSRRRTARSCRSRSSPTPPAST
jgi:hypothetical protein